MKPDIDDYPTCAESHATLRCYHKIEGPEVASAAFGIEASDTQKAGDSFKTGGKKTLNGWFLKSEPHIASYDANKHVSWILDQIKEKTAAVHTLLEKGWRIEIVCMWESACGHGGPTLSPETLSRLAALRIPIWFDVYFSNAEILSEEKSPKYRTV
jgi:hypothetical protein